MKRTMFAMAMVLGLLAAPAHAHGEETDMKQASNDLISAVIAMVECIDENRGHAPCAPIMWRFTREMAAFAAMASAIIAGHCVAEGGPIEDCAISAVAAVDEEFSGIYEEIFMRPISGR